MIRQSALQSRANIRWFILVMVAFLMNACNPLSNSISSASSVEELSSRYKQSQDYQSLVMLIPHLQSNMTRSDVEQVLGKPGYCPNAGQCYYFSDEHTRLNCPFDGCVSPSGSESSSSEGPPITLVVTYTLANKTASPPSQSDIDMLWSYVLMPIGE
jgi:hypothetical protein